MAPPWLETISPDLAEAGRNQMLADVFAEIRMGVVESERLKRFNIIHC
jgi:hypothetical protein